MNQWKTLVLCRMATNSCGKGCCVVLRVCLVWCMLYFTQESTHPTCTIFGHIITNQQHTIRVRALGGNNPVDLWIVRAPVEEGAEAAAVPAAAGALPQPSTVMTVTHAAVGMRWCCSVLLVIVFSGGGCVLGVLVIAAYLEHTKFDIYTYTHHVSTYTHTPYALTPVLHSPPPSTLSPSQPQVPHPCHTPQQSQPMTCSSPLPSTLHQALP